MNKTKFNLQLLHHKDVFSNREEAITYLNNFYKPNSLDAEPLMVKYGDSKNPNVILAFGTSDAGPGSFYFIDMTEVKDKVEDISSKINSNDGDVDKIKKELDNIINVIGLTLDTNKKENQITYDVNKKDDIIGDAISIVDAINKISTYINDNFNSNKLSVENSKSVNLIYEVNPDGGMELKAKVKISKYGDSDEENFNNNIIGIKNDGLYAASNLSFDEVRNQLVFSTSGYKNGHYQDDAIIQKVNLKKQKELTPINEDNNIKIVVNEDEDKNITNISANVKIANREYNILSSSDGKLFVDGRAKNISYKDTNVNDALEKLETNNKEFKKLIDNISIRVDGSANKLYFQVGDVTKEAKLPGVNILSKVVYDKVNKDIIIQWKDGSQQTIIPVDDMLKTWVVENDNSSPIILHINNSDIEKDKLSATINLRSNDNLISISNGEMFVSENVIDDKVSTEQSRAIEAEARLSDNIDDIKKSISDKSEKTKDSINTVKDSLEEEIQRAKDSENSIKSIADSANTKSDKNTSTLSDLQSNVTENTNKINEEKHLRETLEQSINNQISDVNSKVSTNIDSINNIKETLSNKIESVKVVKNSSNDLQYVIKVDNVDVGEINIPKDNFLSNVEYNKKSKEIVFSFDTKNGSKQTTINIGDLVDSYTAGDGLSLANNKFYIKINEDSEKFLTLSEEGIKLSGITSELEKRAIKGASYTKEESDSKYLTSHQDISHLADSSTVSDLSNKVSDNTEGIKTLNNDLLNVKFKTKESNTIRTTLEKSTDNTGNTLSSEIKIKTLDTPNTTNIIKSDSNGIFATVDLEYNKAENTLLFNDGNTQKKIQLNNFGILEDALYENDTKSIVLIVKKDDSSTNRITIPVSDLFNMWNVENKDNSPIILTKTHNEEGDKLSAQLSILNHAHNLLKQSNGSLFVDSDSNKHYALFGQDETTVQGAINELKRRTDNIDTIKSDLLETKSNNEDMKLKLDSYSNKVDTLEDKQIVNTDAIKRLVIHLGSGYNNEKSVSDRLDAIENALRKLIDFGEY